MRAADFPPWMRALLAVTVILLFVELVIAIAPITAFFTTWSWKVDPGLATLTGAVLGLSIVALQAKAGFNNLVRSQENQARLERDAVKFEKWHEKRVEALIDLYEAFSRYLDFLRRLFYFSPKVTRDVTPMHVFARTIEAKLVFLDDGMAAKITQYQRELFEFWNWVMATGIATEPVRHRLDYEIPAYLSRLRRDINEFLDPKYQPVWTDPRLIAAERVRLQEEEAHLAAGVPPQTG